jgi:hypothetical protein
MDKTKNAQEFLSYIKQPLSKTSLSVLYSANNVKFERVQLFSDFIQSLIVKVLDTYMGDDLTKPEQRVEHFRWCWNKNIEDFKEEGIEFTETGEIYDYFSEFMFDIFYSTKDKSDIEANRREMNKIWKYIFNYSTNKTRSDVELFLEVYKMFEKTL